MKCLNSENPNERQMFFVAGYTFGSNISSEYIIIRDAESHKTKKTKLNISLFRQIYITRYKYVCFPLVAVVLLQKKNMYQQ